MAPKRVIYHVEPRKGGEWAAQRTGTERAAGVFENKADALKLAKELAQGHPLGQVVVHNAKGKIQYENTYGKDPKKYPG